MRNRYRLMVALVVLSAATLGLAACDLGDAAVDVSGEHPVLNFETALGDPAVLPSGGVNLAVGIGGFDLAVADGFARATGALGLYQSIETSFGPAMGFNVSAGFRNSSQDGRAPALVESGASPGDFFGLFNPAWTGVGDGWWDLFGEVTGLKPMTTYTVAVARMALDVRGELDQQLCSKQCC